MRILYIKQKVFKITDHYPVLDEAGNTVYYVNEEFKFFKKTFHVTNGQGAHLFTINKEVLTFLPLYIVRFHDGKELKISSRFTFLRRKIDIDSGGLGYYLEGDFLGFNYSLYDRNNVLIGKVHKKWMSWGDTYILEVGKEADEQVFIAVLIAVDQIIDDANSKTNT